MSKKGSVFILGGIIGAIIALLFSPRNGRQNREIVLENTKKFVNDPETCKCNVVSKLRFFIDKFKIDEEIMCTEDEIIISKDFRKED